MSHSILAIDVETANRDSRSICSVGWSLLYAGEVVETNQLLVNPEEDFDQGNIRVHGIRPSDVWDAPTLPKVLELLYPTLQKVDLVMAHNASFDMGALKKAIAKYDLYTFPSIEYGCTVKLSRKLYPQLPNHKLNTMAEYLNEPFLHHNAAEDARVCALLMRDMMMKTGIADPRELHRYTSVKIGKLAY
ncbi:3'-5' exonuclease [Exiguobacterium alkaliphilum]|uniref:3'-5' exonuclease n=1 Tax=Exiguobacterium alkaliphilum TaxID=1428684 RepID=A0ABT2KXK0_9BACL|nr:3'-5' exonuclease [Exiguobacterium alkaliphilum]MCT4795662.1 3'-5' exonuclease [Exiguobacterium alkaliphilum]